MRTNRISRRDVVAILGGGALGCPRLATGQDAKSDGARWMDQWIKEGRAPIGGLYLGRFADPIYFLTQPITWTPNKGQEQYHEVTATKGFVTDLASIPRPFWSLLRPDGLYAYSAILHDYLYWFQTRPREECDMIFKLGMEDFGIDKVTVTTIYQAVRKAGGEAWAANERARKGGESRILKKFPEDPRTRWDSWKKTKENFE